MEFSDRTPGLCGSRGEAVVASTFGWAVGEFSRAKLGDTRRTRRVIDIATRFAATPCGVVTAAIVAADERQGAYDFMENEKINAEPIAESAYRGTADRCRGLPYVFVPVDGSSLSVADPKLRRGTGPNGSQNHGGRGFQVISALAVAPDGVPLGLIGQEWWSRPEAKATRRPDRRAPETKESRLWGVVMDQGRESMAGTGCKAWFVIDRGGDAGPVLHDAHTDRSWLTVRACYNRRVQGEQGGERQYLWPVVRAEPVVGRYSVQVAERPGRPARTAVMSVRWKEVTLELRDRKRKVWDAMRVWAVYALETSATAAGQEPLEWMLLTTFPVTNFEDACTVLYGYVQRWRIEEFHKAWKSGACNVEDTQLHSARAIHVLAVILAAVAVRLLRMTYLARTTPEVSAAVEFTPAEIDAAAALTRRRKPRKGVTVPLGTVVLWVAEAGGYTGKSSGGPPGFLTLARGLARVRTVVAATESPRSDRRTPEPLRWDQG